VATFSAERTSSDGGAVLLVPLDRQMQLTARLAATIPDQRQAGKITQEMLTLVRQRTFGIAAGYADCNDAAQLAHDPMLKLACERGPLSDPALASQPTLSRFENAVRPRTLLRMTGRNTSVGCTVCRLTSSRSCCKRGCWCLSSTRTEGSTATRRWHVGWTFEPGSILRVT
jgi:hypothetical protein